MSLWRHLRSGLRVLTNRRAADREIDEEVQHYLDEATAEHVARGLSPEQARRAARLEVGTPTSVREEIRSRGWEHAIDTAARDLAYGLRRLRRDPAFTVVSVLTLAIGIGAGTTIFSAVKPVLFEPLPYPAPSRITTVWYAANDGSAAMQSFGTYRELLARSRAFEAMAVFKAWQPTLTGRAEPERYDGVRVSASYFHALGVPPALGRDFDADDDRPNGANVAIISDQLWRRRFAADPAIVGRQITLDDALYTVIGVMPSGFEDVQAPSSHIWSLLQYDTSLRPLSREWGHHLRMIARLRAGVGVEGARRELDAIARVPDPDFPRQPGSSMNHGFIVASLQDDLTRAVKPTLLAIVGAVLLVLTIACVNVSNLLLARGAQRQGEFAMRAALGAGRGRLIRQLLTESLLLAAMGGAVGLGGAHIGVRALVALSPAGLPRISAIHVDRTAFVFAAGISTLVGLAVGLLPALYASRGDLQPGLQQSSLRAARGHRVTRRALVVAEVALALVLLVGAGLLLRSLERVFAVTPGFDASHVLTMQVQVASTERYRGEALNRYFAQALDVVRRVPGVAAAAFTTQLPLSGDDAALEVYSVELERQADRAGERVDAYRYAVSPAYFETMGIPVGRGRVFDERDRTDVPVRPVVISDSFARRAFPGRDPLGQQVRFAGPPNRPWDVVVGVVGDVKQMSLAAPDTAAVYVDTAQWLWADNPRWLVVRAHADAAALAPAVKQAVWSVDKDQPIVRVRAMTDLLAASEAERRFALIVFDAFGVVALALAAIGIYGVLSGGVAERLREIGVRTALGASRRDIVALVVGEGFTLTALGAAVGLTGAAAASRALESLLYGTSRLDPATYVAVVALLAGVSGIACWLPARRAARIDPSITLRAS